jgi:hypothetical protein
MKSLSKLAITMGLLSTFSAVPLLAQMENGVEFTTDFGFDAGGAKFAAGTYRDTEYLSQIAFEGRRFGLELRPTKSEEKAAANVATEESSTASSAR